MFSKQRVKPEWPCLRPRSTFPDVDVMNEEGSLVSLLPEPPSSPVGGNSTSSSVTPHPAFPNTFCYRGQYPLSVQSQTVNIFTWADHTVSITTNQCEGKAAWTPDRKWARLCPGRFSLWILKLEFYVLCMRRSVLSLWCLFSTI